MPKVAQAHLDARRQQIVDAALARFTEHGFAATSMADIVAASGLSTGAIYRYFRSKHDLVLAVCEQSGDIFPAALTAEALTEFLTRLRTLSLERGHSRLTTQIYAEAAVSPELAAVVVHQMAQLRASVAALIRAGELSDRAGAPEDTAEAFIALCTGFSLQLALRGDVDPAPFVRALLAVVGG